MISVALCTYNGEKYIEQQLDSIFNQTVLVGEIIICDDGSTDGTLEIIKSYQAKYESVIKLYVNPVNLGTLKNFENAISLANGELIFLSDQDDIWFKHKVEEMHAFFKKNKHCKLLFSNGELINENSKPMHSTLWDKWSFSKASRVSWLNNNNAFRDLINNNNKITGATICIHKSLKENSLPIKVPFGFWHDAWLGLHASAISGLFFIEKSLIYYRIHENQQVGLSSDISKAVITSSNLHSIERNEFYKNMWNLYKSKRELIPYKRDKKELSVFKASTLKKTRDKLSRMIKKKIHTNYMVAKFKEYLKQKIIFIYENRLRNFYFKQKGFCPCCEQEVFFIARNSWLRDHFECRECKSIPRERALMLTIQREYPNWKELHIHESSPGKRGHSVTLRKHVKHFIETHFFVDKQLGALINGIRNEDLENQTFKDEVFDLVITSDVMEHVYEPDKAFKEIHRTLKPGGAHIFCVPIVNKHKKTQRWATKRANGTPNFLFEPEWHGNPIDKKGSPVTMHWGYDIVDYIKDCTGADCKIEYIDNLQYGIRAEFIEIIVAKKHV